MPKTDTSPGYKKQISKLANYIQSGMNGLYAQSHYTKPTNMQDLRNIKSSMNNSINSIVNNNVEQVGEPNISKLYSRMKALNNDSKFMRNVQDMFSDKQAVDSVLESYLDNKYLYDLDREIDVICKYMPKLMEALDTKKDNVLSADHFSKDFISVPNNTTVNAATFDERIKSIKDSYDLLTLADEVYMTASKYGEQFLYVVPYSRAISKLLQTKGTTSMVDTDGSTIAKISESGIIGNSFTAPTNKPTGNLQQLGVNVELSTSYMIESAVLQRQAVSKKLSVLKESSLCLEHAKFITEQVAKLAEAKEEDPTGVIDKGSFAKNKKKLDQTINADELEIPEDELAKDGMIINNGPSDKDGVKDKINVPGCIVKKLDRAMIKPIYVEDICLGYYYMELKKGQEFNFEGNIFDPMTNLKKQGMQNNEQLNQEDMALRQTAAQISKYVDAKFINNNIDLSKEIYMILKYNDMYNNPNQTIKITYIPPEDIIHVKFREDPKTHRGISDLDKALFPAKLYNCIYLTNAIANMTRGYDKRVYYVKQTVDTNIAKTLLNTINQLKKSNFGLRQVENINNILNITGMLNDYLIPTNGGDPPVQFEIMQGQRVDAPSELLQMLEEMAINSTDVPLELIQARQSMDYAVHYTMTNSKFLRKVYNRQGQYQRFLSDLVTKIYNYEYDSNVELKVTLPPPVFLNITNTNQIIQNTNDFSEAIVNIQMADEPDDLVRAIYAKKVKQYYLASYLDTSVLERLETEAKQEAKLVPKQEAAVLKEMYKEQQLAKTLI